MNNFEIDEKAKEMVAGNSAYKLARRVIELEAQLKEKTSIGEVAVDIDVGFLKKEIPEIISEIRDEWVSSYHSQLLGATQPIFHPHLEGVRAVFESKLKSGDL